MGGGRPSKGTGAGRATGGSTQGGAVAAAGDEEGGRDNGSVGGVGAVKSPPAELVGICSAMAIGTAGGGGRGDGGTTPPPPPCRRLCRISAALGRPLPALPFAPFPAEARRCVSAAPPARGWPHSAVTRTCGRWHGSKRRLISSGSHSTSPLAPPDSFGWRMISLNSKDAPLGRASSVRHCGYVLVSVTMLIAR